MLNKKNNRQSNEVNAGSMADIAFLLLIFFLVTTTIINDQGIMVRLPPLELNPTPPPRIPERNVLTVKINKENNLLVEGEMADLSQLRELTKNFILNPTGSEHLARKPTLAVVSLQNDRGTSYTAYLSVYNELKAAYNELWAEHAIQTTGTPYAQLAATQQKSIRNKFPLVISEADPTEY